jgi:hypothetical protein
VQNPTISSKQAAHLVSKAALAMGQPRCCGNATIAPWRPAGFIIAVNASERLAV